MKPGIYKVRGNAGHGQPTAAIDVEITAADPPLARFVFCGERCVYQEKPRSPFPVRLEPAEFEQHVTARSVAHAAFKAAAEAAKAPPESTDDGDDPDVDSLTIGAMRARSAGSVEGSFTRHAS